MIWHEGEQGIQGNDGKNGEKGDKGERGDRGEMGIEGLQGEKGNDGTKIYHSSSLEEAPKNAIIGDMLVVDDTKDIFIYE